VKNMRCLFERSKFNGDISQWNVSKATNTFGMFRNSPIEKNPPRWYKE